MTGVQTCALPICFPVTIDCQWKNKNSIIDFKTSKKNKRIEWIEHYCVQEAIYALLVADQHKMVITNGVIIMSVDNSDPQIFEVDLLQYIPKALQILGWNK